MDNYLNHTYTKEDIENYIKAQAEESQQLEFKAAAALSKGDGAKASIAKDVSGFANADGGVLIYGLIEKNHKADNIDPVDGNEFTQEWLQQVIDSRIQRKINGLIIDCVRFKGAPKTVYVIKIPRSLNAPHQVSTPSESTKKWYKRRGTIVVEMEEHEVREAYNRMDKTLLELLPPIITGGADPVPHYASNPIMQKYSVRITISIKNIGLVIEKIYKLEVRIPAVIITHSHESTQHDQFFRSHQHTEAGYHTYSVPHKAELYQDEVITAANINLILNANNILSAEKDPIFVKLYYSSGTQETKILLCDNLTHTPHTPHKPTPHKLSSKCFHENEDEWK